MTDRLFTDCCYGSPLQHGENEPCPRLLCCGCGAVADDEGETGCDCPTGLLFNQAERGTWRKPSSIRADIAEAEAYIIRLQEQIATVCERASCSALLSEREKSLSHSEGEEK